MSRQRKSRRNTASLLFSLIIVTQSNGLSRQFSSQSSSSLCHDRKTLYHNIIVSFSIELCLNFVAIFSCWLQHSSFGLLEFCIATNKNYVATQTDAFSTFLLFSLIFFQITPAKHKVGEYSIIWHTNRSKIVKNMSKKWIKNIRV